MFAQAIKRMKLIGWISSMKIYSNVVGFFCQLTRENPRKYIITSRPHVDSTGRPSRQKKKTIHTLGLRSTKKLDLRQMLEGTKKNVTPNNTRGEESDTTNQHRPNIRRRTS